MLGISLAARLYMTALSASDRLEEAHQARATGRGRRPSAAAIDRLEHRQIVAAQAYGQAVEALKAAAPPVKPETYTEEFNRLHPAKPGGS